MGLQVPGVAVFGITGRMGQSLAWALRESPQALRLSGALASASSGRLGLDAAAEGAPTGVRVSADLEAALADAAVALEFSTPLEVGEHAGACAARRVPLLVGTTGFDAPTRAILESAALCIPVLIAPNTSVGVGVLRQLVGLAAAALGEGFDVEVSEAHHRGKRDAPSGTALALGEAVAQARGAALADIAVYERHGVSDPRKAGSVGFSVLRAGDIVGEHTVTFASAGERLELTHRATDRMVFARGALRAAEWLIGRPAGLYGMRDVLGL
jgi:4-hydroxy-tetrahydrodipicolinate reductase